MSDINRRWAVPAVVVVVLGAGGYFGWQQFAGNGLPEGIAEGNGRIEATEIDVSAKSGGRISDIPVNDGDFVKAGDVVARMDVMQIEAQHRQAEAQLKRAVIGIDVANSVVTQREAAKKAAAAVVAQRQVQRNAAQARLARSEQLAKTSTISQQVLDDDRASALGAEAVLNAALADQAAADAAIGSAKAQVVDAEAAVDAAKAAIEVIVAQINDATLTAPRDGRIQYRIAQPGEVVSAGGRVVDLVDLGDVYMTFFLPTAQAGRVAIGTEVRIILDAAPQLIIPATVSFVSDVAQFTPKTVETEEERQKLTFRIKARIPPALLKKYIKEVKTGLPGVAFVRLDPNAKWPASVSGTPVQ